MKSPASASPETICARAAAPLSSGLSDEALELLELARDNFPTQASVASRYADALHLPGGSTRQLTRIRWRFGSMRPLRTWLCASRAAGIWIGTAQTLNCAVALQADAGGPNLNLGKANLGM
jgi:hypothetical protein